MGYDDVKVAGKRRYTGMKIGGTHHWDYPDGVWTETKTSPDRWNVRFTSTKRRKRRAPEGSGAKTGAEYHWFILAHQRARKLDANSYATDLAGMKLMVAFRQPGWERWSSQFKGHRKQRQILIDYFRKAIEALEAQEEPDGNDLALIPGMRQVALLSGRPSNQKARKASTTRRRPTRPSRAVRPRSHSSHGRAKDARPIAAKQQS